MIERVIVVLLVYLAAILLPPWVSVIGAAVIVSRYSGFEIIPLGFLLDLLYGVPVQALLGIPVPTIIGAHVYALFFTGVYALSVIVKRTLIFYGT